MKATISFTCRMTPDTLALINTLRLAVGQKFGLPQISQGALVALAVKELAKGLGVPSE